MTDERVVDDIVTKFLLNTCPLCPLLTEHAAHAASFSAWLASERPKEDVEARIIPLITGSAAEFYIEPMLPHVGDIDIMHYDNYMLAVPRGHPPPTQLPAEFHNYVMIVEITDSHLSGYVYLELRYLLTKCTDSGRYNAIEYEERGMYLSTRTKHAPEIHGPAWVHQTEDLPVLSTDVVHCVRCLSWPPQAADWPSRLRNYGWPDSATVGRVVSDGCDMVQVAHRQCRQDEWMNRTQYRLSFSRAEITLINSWMPVQQIVYHILRVFVKTEHLRESTHHSGVSTLSNYHIKTLMLWACELKPQSWWTDDLSLTSICVELLHTLAVWLIETRCPHYFNSDCNLVDNPMAFGMTASRLLLVDKSCLSSWFINNYIRQSVQICPENVSRLFDDVSTTAKLQNAVSAVVDWRLKSRMVDLWRAFDSGLYNIIYGVSIYSVNERSCVCWMTELCKIDTRLSVYFIAVAFLHVAIKLSRGGLDDNIVKAAVVGLTTIQSVALPKFCNKRLLSLLNKDIQLRPIKCKCQQPAVNSTDSNTSELAELLQQSAVEFRTTFCQIQAREFAYVSTIVTTDFEALYAYKHGGVCSCQWKTYARC